MNSFASAVFAMMAGSAVAFAPATTGESSTAMKAGMPDRMWDQMVDKTERSASLPSTCPLSLRTLQVSSSLLNGKRPKELRLFTGCVKLNSSTAVFACLHGSDGWPPMVLSESPCASLESSTLLRAFPTPTMPTTSLSNKVPWDSCSVSLASLNSALLLLLSKFQRENLTVKPVTSVLTLFNSSRTRARQMLTE
jgi:hypothetical protein